MCHIAGAEWPPWELYDFDVVILALDRAEETVAAIRSALDQTGVTRYVIVVDQGSRPEALARLADTVSGRDDATLFALESNVGVPGGRNIGTGLGHGRIIAGLDNDAVFASPDTLAEMAAAFDDDPDLGALGCRIVVDATGDDDLSSWGYPLALLPRSREAFDTATFVGAGHAIRRETWNDAGGYDASLFFCWEEYDFCLRAINRRWLIRYRGDIVIRHKVATERRVTWSGDRWFHYVRNRIVIGRKIGQSWLALIPRMVGYCVKAARNGCLRDTPRALWAAIRMTKGVQRDSLSPAARAYLFRTDIAWRGSMLTRLRRDVFAVLPGSPRRRFRPPAQATEASIRAITSTGGAPASAAATHSASSRRFFTPSTSVSIGSDRA
jgi:GT2 family glycosyltransferase